VRILHTADWHVGKALRGRPRLDEHQAVLAELVTVADHHDVDVVVVAGDLFDSTSPPPEAERLVYRALLELAGDQRQVIVVAGNHDSPRRLQAVAPLAHLGRIWVQAFVAHPDQGGVLELRTRRGDRLVAALLPWLSQRYVITADALLNRDADQHQLAYQDRVRSVVGALTASFAAGATNVVVGHLHALGGVMGGGERPAHTVLEYAVPATVFPAATGYVALGHLHRAQRVDGPAPTWYPGSPLALDFGEQADRKAVLVVEVKPGAPAVVQEVPIRAGRRLRTIEGTLAELAREQVAAGEDWLRVVVHEPARAGLADEVRELFPTAVDVRVASDDALDRLADATQLSRLGRSPAQLFDEYLRERKVDDPRLQRLFNELYEVAAAEEREEVQGAA
jgi:exonuclease SbcD